MGWGRERIMGWKAAGFDRRSRSRSRVPRPTRARDSKLKESWARRRGPRPALDPRPNRASARGLNRLLGASTPLTLIGSGRVMGIYIHPFLLIISFCFRGSGEGDSWGCEGGQRILHIADAQRTQSWGPLQRGPQHASALELQGVKRTFV